MRGNPFLNRVPQVRILPGAPTPTTKKASPTSTNAGQAGLRRVQPWAIGCRRTPLSTGIARARPRDGYGMIRGHQLRLGPVRIRTITTAGGPAPHAGGTTGERDGQAELRLISDGDAHTGGSPLVDEVGAGSGSTGVRPCWRFLSIATQSDPTPASAATPTIPHLPISR